MNNPSLPDLTLLKCLWEGFIVIVIISKLDQNDKVSRLWSVYDKIYINIRGLEPLGVTPEQYGSLLIPVIMSKLPSDVRLQVARVTTKEVWEVQELLTVIKGEVEAREIRDTIKINERKGNDG